LKAIIPFFDFGGEGSLVHFSHSNGYTPACFQQVMAPLLPHYRVIGACHRPLWPGSQPEEMENWEMIADDLLRFFGQEGFSSIIGIGHSLGAIATMYAALKRPEIFKCLVLIEPIFLPPVVLQMVEANPDVLDELPLIRNTYQRRQRWSSRRAAFNHFRGKSVFKRWSDAALWDYVNHALSEMDSGEVALTYSREWEVRFYTRPPLDVWRRIPKVTHPVLAIRGVESDALFPEAWKMWQELQPQSTFVEIQDAGHMLLMERPALVAQTILSFLEHQRD
jgi:pimeloyl-ACP methyl ester carboxylesterase